MYAKKMMRVVPSARQRNGSPSEWPCGVAHYYTPRTARYIEGIRYCVRQGVKRSWIRLSDTIANFAPRLTDFSAVDPIGPRSKGVMYITGYTVDISYYTVKDETALEGLPREITEIPTIIMSQALNAESPFSAIIASGALCYSIRDAFRGT